MNVNVSIYGPLRDKTGQKTLASDVPTGATVRDLLDRLVEEFPELEEVLYTADGTVSEQIVIVKNNINIWELDGVETALDEDDSVRLSTQVVGGC